MQVFYHLVLKVNLLQCLGSVWVRVIVTNVCVHMLQQSFFGCDIVKVRWMVDDRRLRE